MHEPYKLSQEAVEAATAGLAPQLRSLELHASSIGEHEWRLVMACTGLTRLALRVFSALCLESEEGGGGPALLALTRLRGLQELSIDHRPAMCAASCAGQLTLPPAGCSPCC